MGVKSVRQNPHSTSFRPWPSGGQDTVIVVGLLGQGLPCPFFPVPFPIRPFGLTSPGSPFLSAGLFATYSCEICCSKPYGSAVALAGSRFHHKLSGGPFIAHLENQRYNCQHANVKFFEGLILTFLQPRL